MLIFETYQTNDIMSEEEYIRNEENTQKAMALAQIEFEKQATTKETIAIPIMDDNKSIGSVKLKDVEILVDAVEKALQMIGYNNSVVTTNPYPEVFKKGGFGLFTYLFRNITQLKPLTRATVLFHSMRDECFTDSVKHENYIAFLKKEYKV